MAFHVLLMAEAFRTHVAAVGALAGVLAQVRLYQPQRSERLVAEFAFVGTQVPVHLHVSHQSALVLERHIASVATERSVRVVAF